MQGVVDCAVPTRYLVVVVILEGHLAARCVNLDFKHDFHDVVSLINGNLLCALLGGERPVLYRP